MSKKSSKKQTADKQQPKPVEIRVTGKLPNAFRLFFVSLRILARNWKVFGGIILIYGLLSVLLVQGLSVGDLDEAKQTLEDATSGQWGKLVNSVALFSYLVGASGGASNEAAGAYQMILALITSLALIWVLREVYAGSKVRIRDGFYRGMYPLIPFLLVLGVVILQLVPALVGGLIYGMVSAGNIGPSGPEILIWTLVFGLSILVSVYMLCSSLFALYIVCLPDMRPLAALRSARGLVKHRRWTVMRKVIFLPIAMAVSAAIITIPIIFVAAPVAGVVFFVLSMAGLAIAHSYMYRLYRELL
jgi:hypothetical protein